MERDMTDKPPNVILHSRIPLLNVVAGCTD